MERLFRQPQQRSSEQASLLLLGAANDALRELGIKNVVAASVQQEIIFFHAASPAIRVMVLARMPEVQQKIKATYQRRNGTIVWKRVVVRVGAN